MPVVRPIITFMIKCILTDLPAPITQFFKFGVVGTLGFIVDAGVLYGCMLLLGMGPYAGRVVSFLAGVTITWFCNRHFTFKSSQRADSLHLQWSKFFVVCLGGFVFNYGAYALLVTHSPLVAIYPVIGVAVGSLTGMFFNFFAAKHMVFK